MTEGPFPQMAIEAMKEIALDPGVEQLPIDVLSPFVPLHLESSGPNISQSNDLLCRFIFPFNSPNA